MKKLITLIIAAYNEEEVLYLLYDELLKLKNEIDKYNFEILFVNDGSKDKTLEIIKELRKKDKDVSYVSLSRNFGKEVAMLAGMDYAKGDAVVFMDADLQDPPHLIHEFIKCWEEGYDDVYAKRKSRKGETWLKKFTSKMYYKVLNKISKVPIQVDTGDFRLLDRRVVNALKKVRETSRATKSIFSWVGYKKKEVYFDRPERAAGETKWNYGKLINLAIDGITSLTTSPLKLSTYIAIPTGITFLIYLIYVIIKAIVVREMVHAYQAIILLILLFFGIHVILMGILGEYIGRIFVETKGRPVYLIDEYNDEKELNE